MVGQGGHRGWVYDVAVAPAHRDAGFGGIVVRAGEDWLRARGIRKAQLLVRETNTAVRAFYARIGWAASPRTVMDRWLSLPCPLALSLAPQAGTRPA